MLFTKDIEYVIICFGKKQIIYIHRSRQESYCLKLLYIIS